MAGLLEVAAEIAADKEQVDQLAGALAATKDQAEQSAGELSGMGVDGSAARMQRVADAIEEAESLRSALEGGLQKAHWQAMSAVHGNMGPGARGSGPGGAVVPLHQVGGPDGGPVPGGQDAIPPHLRQDPTPTGEELMGIDSTIGPFQKEHEGANDDRKMSRLARASRIGVRNVGDLKASGQQHVAGANADADGFDPPPAGGYNTMTQVPDHLPQIHSVPASQPSATDLVGSAIVIAVVIAESAGRLIERRKRRKNGG